MIKDKTEIEQQQHAEMLTTCKNILESRNIPAILTGSALLGAHRDGDLIPWCPGAVLSTFSEIIKQKENEIIKDLKNEGFLIEKHFININNYKIRVSSGKFNVEIVGYTKNKKFFYRKLKNKKKIIPKKYLSKPYGEIMLRGTKYKTPLDIEGFLSFVYIDWKTPIRSDTPSTYKTKNHMIMDASK